MAAELWLHKPTCPYPKHAYPHGWDPDCMMRLDPEQVVTIPALAHWSFGYETLSLPLRTVIDALKEEE